jgi:hypothetical protein
LVNDFWGLSFDLGLYINTKPFLPISAPFGLPILLNVFWVVGPVLLQVAGMLSNPSFEPCIIIAEVIGMSSSPVGVIFSFQRLLAGRAATGLPPFPYSRIKGKKLLAIRTPFLSHLGFPLALE